MKIQHKVYAVFSLVSLPVKQAPVEHQQGLNKGILFCSSVSLTTGTCHVIQLNIVVIFRCCTVASGFSCSFSKILYGWHHTEYICHF